MRSKMNMATALLAAALAGSLAPIGTKALAQEEGRLQVVVSDIEDSRGHIRVAVCSRNTFLGPNCQFHGSALAQPGTVTVNVDGLPPGVYAAQVFHDEDDSRKVKRTLIGIPEEDVGFSNDAPMSFGPPDFAHAAFRLTAQGGQISIHLKHFG